MAVVTTLPHGRALRVRDLESIPDDGHRYELIDGSLVVTPAPGHLHQRAAFELAVALRAQCPPDLEVVVAPFEVRLDDHTSLQPDVLVARVSDITSRGLRGPPVLAVEVASPSTRLLDLNFKRARMEAAGCPAYWVIDPVRPSLTAWELDASGTYAVVADIVGDADHAFSHPFTVTVSPEALVTR